MKENPLFPTAQYEGKTYNCVEINSSVLKEVNKVQIFYNGF